MIPEVRRHSNVESLSLAAAALVVELAEVSLRTRGRFTLVLSGGTSPRMLYELLAQPPFAERMPWSRIYLFWGDERCVPPDHPHSNFGLARQALLSKVPVPAVNVYPMPGAMAPPEAAAAQYEESLRAFFQAKEARQFPVFDLLLLGLGKDGHTASLFPGDAALDEELRWTRAVRVTSASPPVPRITLTFPVINRARTVLFLVSGAGKKKVLDEILSAAGKAWLRYPAARVRPSERLLWLTDEG
ncbi:MAG TPA: 6-phosphogluconolactonase [Syntrophobacteria bacterium]|nr:6-phosphogluconolactonase [Syntrophobacteria bacterium]